ncbi:MAG: hypothetical protein WC284_13445 [Candidimonas sp.]
MDIDVAKKIVFRLAEMAAIYDDNDNDIIYQLSQMCIRKNFDSNFIKLADRTIELAELIHHNRNFGNRSEEDFVKEAEALVVVKNYLMQHRH